MKRASLYDVREGLSKIVEGDKPCLALRKSFSAERTAIAKVTEADVCIADLGKIKEASMLEGSEQEGKNEGRRP